MIINNVAYSWAMVQLTSLALTGSANPNPIILAGVSAIEWEREKKVEVNYGLGGEPVNRGIGNTRYSAKITMDYNTQVQLRALKDSLMALGEFDLVISFANEFNSQDFSTETVTLKGCMFNKDGMSVSQDDTNITTEFDLNVFKIELNTK